MWLFAYGSLMWRPGFAYRHAEPACLQGWVRRFWQGSTDHRGTETAPGRVVTLLPDSRRHCIGLAYQIQTEGLAAAVSELDFREKGGYRREQLPLTLRSGARVTALTYVARPDNRNYLGPDDLNNMADQIILAHGPSGANLDYLRLLEHALLEAGGRDLHVNVLMAAIRRRGGLAPLSWPRGRPRFGPAVVGAAP